MSKHSIHSLKIERAPVGYNNQQRRSCFGIYYDKLKKYQRLLLVSNPIMKNRTKDDDFIYAIFKAFNPNKKNEFQHHILRGIARDGDLGGLLLRIHGGYTRNRFSIGKSCRQLLNINTRSSAERLGNLTTYIVFRGYLSHGLLSQVTKE